MIIFSQLQLSHRPIANWEGIPDDVDDALQYDNGYTYFFKKGEYYRFNDRYFKVNNLYYLYLKVLFKVHKD